MQNCCTFCGLGWMIVCMCVCRCVLSIFNLSFLCDDVMTNLTNKLDSYLKVKVKRKQKKTSKKKRKKSSKHRTRTHKQEQNNKNSKLNSVSRRK